MPKLSYTWRMRVYVVLGVVLTIAFGVAAGQMARIGEPGEYFWFIYPALLALSSVLGVLSYLWWRSIDDVQKSGQVNSWYLGGCAGAFAFVLYLIAERAVHSEYGLGAVTMFGAQFVGFVVFWTVWKLRGMGRSE